MRIFKFREKKNRYHTYVIQVVSTIVLYFAVFRRFRKYLRTHFFVQYYRKTKEAKIFLIRNFGNKPDPPIYDVFEKEVIFTSALLLL